MDNVGAEQLRRWVDLDDVDPLLDYVQSNEPGAQAAVLGLMEQLLAARESWGSPNIARTMTALHDDVPGMRALLVQCIGREEGEMTAFLKAVEEFRPKSLLPLVLEQLTHPSRLVRVCAVDALSCIGDLQTAAVLRGRFDSETDVLVRAHLPTAVVDSVVRDLREFAAMVLNDDESLVRNYGGLSLLVLLEVSPSAWPSEGGKEQELALGSLVEFVWTEFPELRGRLGQVVPLLRSDVITAHYSKLCGSVGPSA